MPARRRYTAVLKVSLTAGQVEPAVLAAGKLDGNLANRHDGWACVSVGHDLVPRAVLRPVCHGLDATASVSTTQA